MNRVSITRLLIFFGLTILVSQFTACAPSSSKGAPTTSKDDGSLGTTAACETDGPMQMAPNADGKYKLVNVAARADRFCALILPLDSQSLNAVLRGAKTVDYRRSIPTDRFSHIIYFNTKTLELYATAELDHMLAGTPRDIAELTATNAGLNMNGALNYFGGRNYGFAVTIKNPEILAHPMSLEDAHAIDSRFARPYSYLFLERHPKLNQEFAKRLGLASAL